MNDWTESVKAALLAVPKDVPIKAVISLCKRCLQADRPVAAVERGYAIPILLNTPAFLEAWALYAAHRIQKRAKMTPLAAQQQLKALEKLGVERAIAAIQHSVSNGWTGIYEPQPAVAPPVGMPLFKRLEVLKEMRNTHVCNVDSVEYDKAQITPATKAEYAEVNRKIHELEQLQRQQALR